MNIQINIKNSEARALADEIVKRTGESMTEAVTESLKIRLKRLDRDRVQKKWVAIMDRNSSKLTAEPEWPDHGELLYDDNGLPS